MPTRPTCAPFHRYLALNREPFPPYSSFELSQPPNRRTHAPNTDTICFGPSLPTSPRLRSLHLRRSLTEQASPIPRKQLALGAAQPSWPITTLVTPAFPCLAALLHSECMLVSLAAGRCGPTAANDLFPPPLPCRKLLLFCVRFLAPASKRILYRLPTRVDAPAPSAAPPGRQQRGRLSATQPPPRIPHHLSALRTRRSTLHAEGGRGVTHHKRLKHGAKSPLARSCKRHTIRSLAGFSAAAIFTIDRAIESGHGTAEE